MSTLKGTYRPRNPEKYQGDPRGIVYRSSWELTCMKWLDLREDVQKWSSEEKIIPYFDPVQKKWRRYFPDFVVKYKNRNGIMVTEILEVKPKKDVIGPPQNPKRRTKAWMNAVRTYLTNQAKWKAAANYCEDRGWSFRILTEEEIYGK